MKIYFDHKIFFLQKYGGISKYFIKLAENLSKIGNNQIKIISPIYVNEYLKGFDKDKVIKFCYLKKNYKNTTFLGNFINSKFTNIYTSFRKPNIFHLTYFSEKSFIKKKMPIVITVYDLIHEKYPSSYKYNQNLKKEYLKIADHIICISHNTKKDLQKYYDIDEKKISVIHLGVEQKSSNVVLKNDNEKPYILYVGERKKYKNFLKFFLAFSLSNHLKKNFRIVCFGGGNFTQNEIDFFKSKNIELDLIKQIEGDDDNLDCYYRNASLFIFPSLYEGFGLPILEAISKKCPIACSDIEIFREIGQNLVNYFDPNDEISIKTTIEKTLDNVHQEKIKIDNNFDQFTKKFTWDNCARKTLDVYKKISL